MDDQERRMTYRVTSEWVGLKRDKKFPSIDFLHPNSFSVDWNQCVLIRLLNSEIAPGADSLEYEFIGEGFRRDTPVPAAGLRVGSISDGSLLSLSSPCLQKLFERGTAVIYGGCLPWRSSNAIYFRAIAVPFSDTCGELKYALGALSHKLSNEVLSPENLKTEFLEFCDGVWTPLEERSDPELVSAA